MASSNRFDNTLVVVTGGSRGIGRATAELFADLGARVVWISRHIASRDDTPLLTRIRADLSETERLDSLVARILEQFGVPSVLVNNAAVNLHSSFGGMVPRDLEIEIRTNLIAPIVLTSLVGNAMARCKRGAIINVGSVKASEAGRSVGYGASKAGLESLTRSAAAAFGPYNVRVNAVAPGPVDTEMFEQLAPEIRAKYRSQIVLARPVKPAEVASTIAFLASESATAITGAVLRVDGGYRL